MSLEVKNIDVGRVIEFLEKIELKGNKSIKRTKLTNKMSEVLREISEGEKTIREDYKDDKKKMIKELETYFEEKQTFENASLSKSFEVISEYIKEVVSDESEAEFNGTKAYVLNLLYEQLVESKETKKGGE